MSQEIKINYQEVYTKTAELRRRIQSELQEMEGTYRQANALLQQMDGSTNAAYMESMYDNCVKAQATAETLTKLLSFIEASARHVEREESMLADVYKRARVYPKRR